MQVGRGMREIEVFATGLQMGESPRWHDGRFWVCDWMAGEVLVFDDDGSREVVARVEGLPFSIDWLPDGRLVATTPAGLVVGPELTPYAAEGVGFNEVVVADEVVYVDQPGSMPWEERKPGIVGVVTPDGQWREVAGDVWFPNGMAVTEDGATLLVAESHADRITAFTLEPDGALSGRRVWADLGEGAAPDGICLDADGAVWYASVPQQACVRVAEGGEVLERIDTGQPAFACMLGGDDGRTLYAVCNDYSQQGVGNGRVLRVRVDVPHAGRP
jgi:sugar lactone lactonase YvrE